MLQLVIGPHTLESSNQPNQLARNRIHQSESSLETSPLTVIFTFWGPIEKCNGTDFSFSFFCLDSKLGEWYKFCETIYLGRHVRWDALPLDYPKFLMGQTFLHATWYRFDETGEDALCILIFQTRRVTPTAPHASLWRDVWSSIMGLPIDNLNSLQWILPFQYISSSFTSIKISPTITLITKLII